MQYRSHRYPTQFPLRVQTRQGSQQGEVVDVNHSGARLTGLKRLSRGDKIQLDILSHRVEAVVLWAARGGIGVMFRPKLCDHHLDTLRQRCNRRSTPQRGQVGFTFVEMS
ncbi:PilZ domain-containing protein [Yoonia sp.]|uniref:PilZ domain-containing protein n=1 Tax=Yoonia sp. TaxID=2212373 RepID=UPI0023365D20|nr:PilZ domain-containing protein [Yoonia sp.]MDB4254544.1 PilZ domain-containing protein [bacterium]